MNNLLKRRLAWKLRVMMSERNITTAVELHRLVVKSGYDIASSQLTRIINTRPERISTDLLDHLLEVLNCEVGDLLRSEPVSDENPIPQSKKKRVRREPLMDKPGDDISGPKLTAFPIPPRKK